MAEDARRSTLYVGDGLALMRGPMVRVDAETQEQWPESKIVSTTR